VIEQYHEVNGFILAARPALIRVIGQAPVAAAMEEARLVVVAKGNQLSAADKRPWLRHENQALCRQFVQRGGGLLLVHGGACYKDLPEMRGVTGGAFLRHPPACPVMMEPVAGHPLTAGVDPFSVNDEHYSVALDASDAEVFLRSRSEHGVQPAGWTRSEGAGRVWVLSPGHNLAVWLQPEFQVLLRHGLDWCAKRN
jgi:type 1 glutamine amidotransferase